MRWAGTVARILETRNSYKMLVGKYEGKDYAEDHNKNNVF
jgi:hypothetical protein